MVPAPGSYFCCVHLILNVSEKIKLNEYTYENVSNQKAPFQNLLFHIGQGSSNQAHEIHFPVL